MYFRNTSPISKLFRNDAQITYSNLVEQILRRFLMKNLTLMRKSRTIISLLCLVILGACTEEPQVTVETSSLKLSFTANFDGEPIVMNEKTYLYNGNPIRFSKVNFYLSDLTLGGKEIIDVTFVDLTKTHTSEQAAEEGTVLSFSKIPVGAYNAIELGIGVPADLNRTKPSEYSTSHPLGSDNTSEYWEAWNSYIFVKIEGQYDSDNDGFDEDDVAFAYHVGQDEFYKKLSNKSTLDLDIVAGEPTDLELRLDIKQLFTADDGNLLELETHDPSNQMDVMRLLMDNFKTALAYRF